MDSEVRTISEAIVQLNKVGYYENDFQHFVDVGGDLYPAKALYSHIHNVQHSTFNTSDAVKYFKNAGYTLVNKNLQNRLPTIWKVSHGTGEISDESSRWLDKNHYISVHRDTGKNQGNKFYNEVQVGDIVSLYRSGDVKALVRVASDILTDASSPLGQEWLLRKYEVIYELPELKKYSGVSKGWSPSYNNTIGKLSTRMAELALFEKNILQPYYGISLENLCDRTGMSLQGSAMDNHMSNQAISTPLNLILYGPPGTGKTYRTIDKALAILEPTLLAKPGVSRDELKAAFYGYQEAGQVAFVTFHQSFSYEDFVEGIRADSREDGGLEYKVEPGVFANICERAGWGVIATDDPFEQSLRKLAEQAEQSDDGWLPMQTIRSKCFRARYSAEKCTFLVEQENRLGNRNPDSANMDHVRTLYQTGKKVGYNPSYVQGMLDYLKKYCGLPSQYLPPVSSRRKPFVLIIDEINRGNVSRIFGELITLIEPSKRAGASEALTTILPYSKRHFSVPDNLYLIGTMNTADRSLSGLDIALRRRFEFEEMPPRPELLEDVVVKKGEYLVNVGELLNVLNQRIEVLLDRDHCLGHANFMLLKEEPKLDRLSAIFQNQVLPLLQEYFFEDWQRIAWVLNDHRKNQPETMFLQAPKLDIKSLLGDVPVGRQRQRWVLNSDAFDNIASYALTITGDKEGQ